MKSTGKAWAVIQSVAAEIRAQPEMIREPERGEDGKRIKCVGRGLLALYPGACPAPG